MTTTVVNLRKAPFDVYIGRAGKGQVGYFGNPFPKTDPECLQKFKTYFEDRVAKDAAFRERVLGLKGKALGCFCKPGPCHGDLIAAWANDAWESGRE